MGNSKGPAMQVPRLGLRNFLPGGIILFQADRE